ncbi:MAG: metal-dependent hydrolase [Fuerstiella sp.]
MTTRLTWLGHATFQIETAGKTILLDPFFTGNPVATRSADDVQADVILVTHGHGDHIGDTVAIAGRTGALVIANFEIITWLQGQGVQNVHPMHLGGCHQFDFGIVRMTVAHHGSALPDNSYGGNPAGFVLKTADGNLYFAGDTALFSDMQLIGDEDLAVATVPIGDNFTMGPEDAVKATRFLSPKVVIPQHYNTWPVIEQDAAAWAERVAAETSARPVVLAVDETYVVGADK